MQFTLATESVYFGFHPVPLQFDSAAFAKLQSRYVKRKLYRPLPVEARKARTAPDFLKRRATLSGCARARLPNIGDINRRAALTRWARYRHRQATGI
jgi:hypothetical protein